MRLVSWNVAGRVARQPEQAAAVAAADPDLVALQEVSPRTLPLWREALTARGFDHVHSSLDRPPKVVEPRRRLLGVLVAARQPLRPLRGAAIPWPERLLAVSVDDELELHVLHSPISPAPGLAKVLTHEAVHRSLRRRGGRAVVLCGDLNTPRRETRDREILTFARTSSGRLRPERGERWDRAELSLIRGLDRSGFRDAFRSLHGYEPRDISWAWPSGGGYRLDHVIVSRPVAVDRCWYEHEWRTGGLSDHSGMAAEVAAR